MIPKIKDKYDSKRSIEPLTLFLKSNQAQDLNEIVSAPECMILCPSPKVLDFVDKPMEEGPKVIMGNQVKFINENVGIFAAFIGFGAPMWTWVLEQLIAWGVKKFIFIGFIGQIDPKLNIDNTLLVEKALRDEGTSYHYKSDSDWAHPSVALNAQIMSAVSEIAPISVWTIDAMFMQTEADIEYGVKNHIAGFEMECSALFTVAEFNNCELSSLQIVSDGYIDGKYTNIYKTPEFEERFKTTFDIAFSVLNK